MITAKELVGKRRIILNGNGAKVPKNQYSGAEYTLTKKPFIVVSAQSYDSAVVYITYQFADSPHSMGLYVGNDFKFEILEGKELQDQLDVFDAKALKNLTGYLAHSFMVGADPEIFVENKKGVVIPAFEFLGSKDKPNSVPTSSGTTTLYWDGYQAEFTTNPAGCLDHHTRSVQNGLAELYKLATKHDKNAVLSIKTVMNIPHDMLQGAKEEHVSFGCMPSLNIYGLKGESIPPREIPFRPAGGHIHFGVGKLKNADKPTVERMIKALDAILGVACVSLFQSFDVQQRRRLYGLPGEYRLPPHGIEYRTLSNAWLFHPMICHLVFGLARKALMFGDIGMLHHWKADEQETIETIINCDVKQAQKILKRNKDLFIELLKASYVSYISPESKVFEPLFDVFINGMESVIKDPSDIVGNWMLKDVYDSTRVRVCSNIDTIIAGKKVA